MGVMFFRKFFTCYAYKNLQQIDSVVDIATTMVVIWRFSGSDGTKNSYIREQRYRLISSSFLRRDFHF